LPAHGDANKLVRTTSRPPSGISRRVAAWNGEIETRKRHGKLEPAEGFDLD